MARGSVNLNVAPGAFVVSNTGHCANGTATLVELTMVTVCPEEKTTSKDMLPADYSTLAITGRPAPIDDRLK